VKDRKAATEFIGRNTGIPHALKGITLEVIAGIKKTAGEKHHQLSKRKGRSSKSICCRLEATTFEQLKEGKQGNI